MLIRTCDGPDTKTTGGGISAVRNSSTLFDDWIPAICQTGTFFETGRPLLPNADADGTCKSARGNIVIIGQYSEQFKANNDLAIFRNQGYAIRADNDGRFCVFISPAGTSVLQPLSRFGFQLGTVQ